MTERYKRQSPAIVVVAINEYELVIATAKDLPDAAARTCSARHTARRSKNAYFLASSRTTGKYCTWSLRDAFQASPERDDSILRSAYCRRPSLSCCDPLLGQYRRYLSS